MARENLYDSPAPRRETPPPAAAALVTGHFHEGPGYDNWRPRGTGDWLLIFTVAGVGRIGTSVGERALEAGDIVLWRPGTPQDYGIGRGAAGWELLWAHFQPRSHWLEWLSWPEAAPGISRLTLPPPVRDRVGERLEAMHQRALSGFGRRDALARNALEEALLWCDSARPDTLPAHRDPLVARAAEYLQGRLAEPIALPELAAHCDLSVSRLSHRFKAALGLTPMQFLERERIARARQLLERTSRPIAAIAADVGFESPFYFSLRFKKQVGLSPRDCRRAARDA